MSTALPIPTGTDLNSVYALKMAFNKIYFAAQDYAKQGLYAGESWAAQQTGQPLNQQDRAALAKTLQGQGSFIDEEIDVYGWDPMSTIANRLQLGDNYEPPMCFTGPSPFGNGPYQGPTPPGCRKNSLDPADWPAAPVPTTGTTPAPVIPKALNPIGVWLNFGFALAAGYIGQYFRCAVPNDGYGYNDTWTGSAQGLSGTWKKTTTEVGILDCWTKVS